MQINHDQIPVPEKLNKVVEQKMDILYREQRVKRIRRGVIGVSTAAACFMGVAVVGITNPAWASQIPLIGNIFAQMQDKFGYPGDYSQVGTPLETEAETQAGEKETGEAGNAGTIDPSMQEADGQTEMASVSDTRYTKTVGDMSVTLSEVYCNGQALNLTMVLKSKEPFPETMRNENSEVGSIPILACKIEENYSFNPSKQQDLVYLQGDFIDECTFAGLIRIDLNTKNSDLAAWEEKVAAAEAEGETLTDDSLMAQYVEKVPIPDSFSLDLTLEQIIGDLANPDIREFELSAEERLALSDEEWMEYMKKEDEKDPSWNVFPNEHENYWYDGPWSFELEVSQSTEGCVTVDIGTVNENGAGMEKIVKTPFEITLYPTLPEEGNDIYFPVILDADGLLMQTGGYGGVVNTVAVGDHDVSTVDVYLFDENEWLDEIKGYYWSKPGGLQKGETLEDGRTFRELCNETCLYHETVEIPDAQ